MNKFKRFKLMDLNKGLYVYVNPEHVVSVGSQHSEMYTAITTTNNYHVVEGNVDTIYVQLFGEVD
jgi:hypothetical protein